MAPAASDLRTPKSLRKVRQSGKSPESLQTVLEECFWIVRRTFGGLWRLGSGGPGRQFRDLGAGGSPKGPFRYMRQALGFL